MNVITVDKRDFTVKAKQLRRSGIVPGNVFGGALSDSISIQMDEGIARRLIHYKREGSKLKLDLDGQLIPVQIKEKTLKPCKLLHLFNRKPRIFRHFFNRQFSSVCSHISVRSL